MPALTLTLSPLEREQVSGTSDVMDNVRLITASRFSEAWQTFPPLLGERAGVREVVTRNQNSKERRQPV
jgi:hypothetical protein